jgi:hypothetical protein
VRRALALASFLLLVLPAVAGAERRATHSERSAILHAVVAAHQLSSAQANCQTVEVSTVDHSWAATSWPSRLSRSCQRVAANGMVILHKVRGRWRFVTVGSEITCGTHGIPHRVQRDLKAGCF